MDDHALRVLEFDKVVKIAAGFAASQPGRDLVAELLPAADAALTETRLSETREFLAILQSGEVPPLEGIPDARETVEKLGVIGSALSPSELLNSAIMLGAGRRIRHFFRQFEEKGAEIRISAPLLCAHAAKIRPLKRIEDEIFSAIDENAEVRDSASPALRGIRKNILRKRDDILGRMTGILQDSVFQKVIQEPVITIRDDRYVLPLKPNFKQSLKGIVHGQSGSRATLFVEPLDILEQNNRLAELRMEEREEVERILRNLTLLLSQEADAIQDMVGALAVIDSVYARARYGIEYHATVPVLSSDRRMRLRNARHPLLIWKQKSAGKGPVAPNDIEFGPDERVLILSGPNAGGKTAILKTLGILCLMAQAGLPVTADEDSVLPCFKSVFADIGDEQSLEQDLSTFSSHVSQIARILREAGRDSLVLLDELGSGTDPAEGAGLGAAVLESLIERGCVTLITTHHSTLKLFGSETRGARNAAMEFDPDTLKPTYRFIPGRPGRSYGLDMAARLGVPDEVIRRARSRIGEDDTRLEKLLKQVEDETRFLAAKRVQVESELSRANRERLEAEVALRAARDEARSTLSRARAEARDVLSSLRRRLRELSHAAVLGPTEVRTIASEVEALGRKLEPEQVLHRVVSSGIHVVSVGAQVSIPKLGKSGRVIGSQGLMLEIEVDGKKIKLAAQDVQPGAFRSEHHSGGAPGWGAELQESEGSPDRLNIIGLRVEEGLAEVERFIDRAGMAGLTVVTVIHGLGTGALKTAVTKFIKNHPLVAAFRTGEPAEGGAGVTVAELKK